jgi:hypothetical protein
VILTTAAWKKLHPGGESGGWKAFTTRGWNAAKGTFIELTLVVKEGPLPARSARPGNN